MIRHFILELLGFFCKKKGGGFTFREVSQKRFMNIAYNFTHLLVILRQVKNIRVRIEKLVTREVIENSSSSGRIDRERIV